MKGMEVWSKWLETGAAFASYHVVCGDDATATLEVSLAIARVRMWGHSWPARADELTSGLVENRSPVAGLNHWYPEAL